MRFHLLMLLLVILVSLGMHGLASAAAPGVSLLERGAAPLHAAGARR